MKIKDVKAYAVQYPEPNDFNAMRCTTLVRLETTDGVVGWGEGITMWPEATQAVVSLVENGLGNMLVGRDPMDIEVLWRELRAHTWWYGEGGIASFAQSAIDIALWDLKGKILGLPIYQLLGGLHWTQGLPACASTHPNKANLDEAASELAGYISEGFSSVKVGFAKKGYARLGEDNKRDLEFVRTVRQAIGQSAGLMIDIGNGVRWTPAQAIEMTRAFSEYDILWIEEPLHPTDINGFRDLRNATATLIATGEREWTIDGYKRWLASGLVDVYGVDPARMGGITSAAKVAEMVGSDHRKFNAHAWSTAITTAASLHVSASSPHCLLMELKPLKNPMQDELIRLPIHQRNGRVMPPERPGLGIEIDERVVQRYQM